MSAENTQPKKLRVPEQEVLNSIEISPYLSLDIALDIPGESAREIVTTIQKSPSLLTNLMYVNLVQHWVRVNESENPLFNNEATTEKPSFPPFAGVEQDEIGVVHELTAEPQEEEVPGSDAITNFASAYVAFTIQKSPLPFVLVSKAREYIHAAIPNISDEEQLHVQLSSPNDVILLEERVKALMHDFRTPVMGVAGTSDLLGKIGSSLDTETKQEYEEDLRKGFARLAIVARGVNETIAGKYVEVSTTTGDIAKATSDILSKEAAITFLQDSSLETVKDIRFIWNQSLQERTIQNIVNNTYDQLKRTINRKGEEKKSLDDLQAGKVSEPQLGAGTIVVSARLPEENGYIELCFTDNAKGQLPKPGVRRGDPAKRKEYAKLLGLRGGQGIGLEGIKEELQQFFDANLYLEQAENGVRTVLRFPIVQST